MISAAEARVEARKQWNANPCGFFPHELDPTFFRRVEAERYRQQYWQKSFFDFEGFADKRVLEIGVGLGTDLKQFARAEAECHAIDIAGRHLDIAQRNFAAEGLRVHLLKADAVNLPYPDRHFDCVYSFGVLHHIPDVERALAEAHRVLKPGGVLQTAVYNRYSLAALAIFAKALLGGSLFRLGPAGILARNETGADGSDIKPYVRLYGAREWRLLVERFGFQAEAVGPQQVNFERQRWMNVFRPFDRLVGWYVAGRFVRR